LIHHLERELRRPVRIAADRGTGTSGIDHVRVELRDQVEVDVDPPRGHQTPPLLLLSISPHPARLAQNSQPRCISGDPARKLLRILISFSDIALNSPIWIAAIRMRALRGRYTDNRTSLSRPSAAAANPWPRISTTEFLPSFFAMSRPWSMLMTRRLVASPNFSSI